VPASTKAYMTSVASRRSPRRPAPRRLIPRAIAITIGVGAAALGCALVAGMLADRPWFDRHVSWPFYLERPVGMEYAVRVALAGVGLLVLVALRWVGARWWGRRKLQRRMLQEGTTAIAPSFTPWPALRIALALGMSLVAAEGAMRLVKRWAHGPGSSDYELRLGQRDPIFGWAARPSHTTTFSDHGRSYSYAVNALGFRSRTETDRPNLAKPTLVVAGESIASGYGLPFDDTFAARCGRDLGLEVVDVAEGGYGIDQAYLRLQRALDQTARPAVVLIVVVFLYLGRGLRDDRPRLILDDAGGFKLVPPALDFLARSRLRDIIHNRLPYVSDANLKRSLAFVRSAVAAAARLTRAHGAIPVFVVPSLGPERSLDEHDEAWLIHEVFPDPALSFVVVDLQPELLLPHDGHPNARGAKKIADAVEAKLCQLPDVGVYCVRSGHAH
jgi:hypothetical protein